MAEKKSASIDQKLTHSKVAMAFARNAVLVFSWATVVKEHALDVIYGMGQSMEPVIPDGSIIVVEKLSRRWRNYERGDVVLLRSPTRSNGATICKRILALVRWVACLVSYCEACWVDVCYLVVSLHVGIDRRETSCSSSRGSTRADRRRLQCPRATCGSKETTRRCRWTRGKLAPCPLRWCSAAPGRL